METQLRVGFVIGEELREALDDFAIKNQLSRSDVVRIALKRFLYDGKGDIHLVR